MWYRRFCVNCVPTGDSEPRGIWNGRRLAEPTASTHRFPFYAFYFMCVFCNIIFSCLFAFLFVQICTWQIMLYELNRPLAAVHFDNIFRVSFALLIRI